MSAKYQRFIFKSFLFALLVFYTLFMFDVLDFGVQALIEVKYAHLSHNLGGLKMFVMLILFLPFVVLLSEMEQWFYKKMKIQEESTTFYF